MSDGRFLVFEGIDGCGKSTQSKQLYQRLKDTGREVVVTFEPSDGVVGRLIRRMLAGEVPVDQRTLAALFAADRTDHLVNAKNGVKPCVDAGNIVVCDRYYFSSYAYHAQYMDMEWVIRANSLNADILRPHVTLFIDVAPEICLDRIRAAREKLDIYEKIDIMKRVRDNYLKAFDRLKDEETVIVINGNNPPEKVAADVWDAVRPFVELPGT
ncbi:MAG: dTMP kinase [Desulfobacterales bacterium]|nr:MAG: dTMP kinase [Desulfobacterales bacterium]